jgi:hypothetical protein
MLTNLEDAFDEEGKHRNGVLPVIEELAQEAVNNRALLTEALDWLVTSKAENGFPFGYALGSHDAEFSLLPALIAALRNAVDQGNASFIGGYFRAIHQKDPETLEAQLDALTVDPELRHWVPELTWRTGALSDKAALRVLHLVQHGIATGHLRMFAFGGVLRNISETVFQQWIKFLLAQLEVQSVLIALDLYTFYYLDSSAKRPLPQELTYELLTHPSLFSNVSTQSPRSDGMEDYHWTEVAKVFIEEHPNRSLDLADMMLEHFGENNTIFGGLYSRSREIINELVRRFPEQLWESIKKFIGPPLDSRAFNIRLWLRGENLSDDAGVSALGFIPPQRIWQWVEEDIEDRPWSITSCVQKGFFRSDTRICFAREVLVRYGDREDVRNELFSIFATGSWSGPASEHYQKVKDDMLNFKKDETDANVRRWIDEYVSYLDKDIERAKHEEERRGF